MGLNIATFSNVTGGNALFKALTHPKAADEARTLIAALRAAGPVAIYDPLGHAEAFANLHSLKDVNIDRTIRAACRGGRPRLVRPERPGGDGVAAVPGEGAVRSGLRRPAPGAADPASHSGGYQGGDAGQHAPAGQDAHQHPALSRPAQLRHQFCLVPRPGRPSYALDDQQLLAWLRRQGNGDVAVSVRS